MYCIEYCEYGKFVLNKSFSFLKVVYYNIVLC